MSNENDVPLWLNRDQALVLSDWLYQMQGSTAFADLVGDEAVWSPLRRISGTLETTLPDIFAPDYAARLEAARERLRPEEE